MPVLLDEIKRVKPKIIVCLGKKPFDLLSDQKMGFADANGGWFWSTKANAHIYVMQNPWLLMMKPEMHETFRVDLMEIARKIKILKGHDIKDLPVYEQQIRNMTELRAWRQEMWNGGYKLFSVDGEWHGQNHVDGDLRSLQFAWTESHACDIRFRDEKNQFAFDLEDELERLEDEPDKDYENRCYAYIGKHLAELTDPKDVKFVGHHFVADAVWMCHRLGMRVLGKCLLDTEFAQQTVDEASELKLERGIAMKYTTLGRYDIDLVLWKRANKDLCKDGYGYIPDKILIPYACKDVIAVLRAVPIIRQLLDGQRLSEYYDETFNPFVTDVFFTFAMEGLPMDVEQLDELRELFHFTRREMEVEFRKRMYEDAQQRLIAKLIQILGGPGVNLGTATITMVANGQKDEAWADIKKVIAPQHYNAVLTLLDHLEVAPNFNIRQPADMRRWLFEVSGMIPVKSTNQKAKGMPSMAWEKVLELPKEKQALYTPSVDKQTMQIMAEKLTLANHLLDLNVVGNVCKAFLKEASTYYDEDLDEEVTEEAGLHKWIASDGRVHGQTSTTETGRPRGWNPLSRSVTWRKRVVPIWHHPSTGGAA